jgi:uncharacterized membrane protein
MSRRIHPNWLYWVLILAIALGVCFRFVNLDRKVFWHDEVYTSMRAAGYTRGEIDNELFQNKMVPASELQKFQQIKPGSTITDTLQSLITEDPQHPPFYFLMARGWMHLWGGSILASRLLPALLSLLSLPLMYLLALDLFTSPLAALVATALIALSPLDVLFAQTARQYGLLTTAVIGSSWLLLRAIKRGGWSLWGLYGVSLAVGMYTHPFFALTIAAHGVCILIFNLCESNDKVEKAVVLDESSPLQRLIGRISVSAFHRLMGFSGALVLSMILYSPWIVVLRENQERALMTTDWARITVGLDYLSKLWTLSYTSLFVDLDFGFNNPLTYLLRLPFVALIILAMVTIYRRTPRLSWIFTLKTIFVPFLLLALPDLIMGGKRSAVSRYLISSYPGVQLAVAYLLAVGVASQKQIWRWVLSGVLVAAIVSCTLSAVAETWWNKDLSYANAEVAALINARASQTSPVVVSDIGDDYTNTGDLISLSYRLKENVRLYLTSEAPNLSPLGGETTVLFFRPSVKLKALVSEAGWRLEEISQPGRLSQLQK